MGIQIKLSTLLKIIWYKTGFYIIHPTKHLNQWHLCLEVYRSTLIQHTYLATPPVHLGVCKTWSLVCLCRHSLTPSVVTNPLCLDTLEWSDSWCVCTVHSTLTGCDASHQVRAFYSLIYYSWMSLEWTIVGHSTPHSLKKSQSSNVVWGRNLSRRRRTLSLARWRMYDELTLSSGKHKWYAVWVGHFAYCRLRIWKFSHWANEYTVRKAQTCLNLLWYANVQLIPYRLMSANGGHPSSVISITVRSMRPLINRVFWGPKQ
jgi:hypothetical protein